MTDAEAREHLLHRADRNVLQEAYLGRGKLAATVSCDEYWIEARRCLKVMQGSLVLENLRLHDWKRRSGTRDC